MAVKLASAEQEALVKEAELYGAAAADGFMSRMQDYEQPFSKQASFGGYSAEDELLVKQAMEMGYQDTMGALEKVASDSYYQGYNDTYNDYGYMDKVASDYSEMEKIASFEKLAAIVKVAEEETTRDGYKIGMKILANMGRGF
jgi:hypothetical protein